MVDRHDQGDQDEPRVPTPNYRDGSLGPRTGQTSIGRSSERHGPNLSSRNYTAIRSSRPTNGQPGHLSILTAPADKPCEFRNKTSRRDAIPIPIQAQVDSFPPQQEPHHPARHPKSHFLLYIDIIPGHYSNPNTPFHTNLSRCTSPNPPIPPCECIDVKYHITLYRLSPPRRLSHFPIVLIFSGLH